MILENFKLAGQKAIVTGGSRGLGRAMALGLAQAGADIAYVSRAANPDLTSEIQALGRVCIHHPADLTNREEAKKVVPELAAKLGGLDILINNAGMVTRHPLVDFPEDEWDRTLELNLTTAFILAQAAGRIMLPQGRGKIINIASIMAHQGGVLVPAYAATKHAIAGLTKSLSNAWADQGINVNAVAPGYFETDLTEALRADPDRSANILGRTPAGRWGKPEELAGAVVFLASPAADFISGSVLSVDGGWLAW